MLRAPAGIADDHTPFVASYQYAEYVAPPVK
jgi:hypothetical protein